MSDDIVTRLREVERLTRNGTMDRDDIADIIDWCADETERLRAEKDGLRIRIYALLKKLDEQAVCGE